MRWRLASVRHAAWVRQCRTGRGPPWVYAPSSPPRNLGIACAGAGAVDHLKGVTHGAAHLPAAVTAWGLNGPLRKRHLHSVRQGRPSEAAAVLQGPPRPSPATCPETAQAGPMIHNITRPRASHRLTEGFHKPSCTAPHVSVLREDGGFVWELRRPNLVTYGRSPVHYATQAMTQAAGGRALASGCYPIAL